jgi:hypothetical protein
MRLEILMDEGENGWKIGLRELESKLHPFPIILPLVLPASSPARLAPCRLKRLD